MKADQMILAVRKEVLFDGNKDYFQGFRKAGEVDYKERILEAGNYAWMRRGQLEENTEFKHPISYSIIVNISKKQVFAFQRAKKEYDEKRLQEQWSWGVGGHIEFIDNSKDPIEKAFLRELEEEIIFEDEKNRKIKNLGYINDDKNAVGKVHFGLIPIVETDACSVRPNPGNRGIAQGRFMCLKELEIMCKNRESEVENWSRIVLPPLKEYLK